ncbi:MAG: hypothetical protein HY913_10160 [Desulfomonile tiedjei]|nr:hypothetical protein [Desulfomonile tiedjei]
MEIKALENLQMRVAAVPDLATQTKTDLDQAIQDVKDEIRIYEKDVWFYRIVVGTLGLAIILIIVALTALLWKGATGFDSLVAIGSAAVGGLVGLLAPSPVGKR